MIPTIASVDRVIQQRTLGKSTSNLHTLMAMTWVSNRADDMDPERGGTLIRLEYLPGRWDFSGAGKSRSTVSRTSESPSYRRL